MSQDSLAVDRRHEADLLIRALKLSQLPNLCHKLVPGPHWRCKPSTKLAEVCWVAAADSLQQRMSSAVIGEQAMDNWSAESKGLAGLLGHMEAVVVSIKTIQGVSCQLSVSV